MKNPFLLFLGFILFTTSCIIKDPPEAITKLIIAKDTNHLIQVLVYYNGRIIKEVVLDVSQIDTITNNDGDGGGFSFFPFDEADSVRVTFDNQHVTMHYRGNHPNNTARNILDLSNWEKIKEAKYRFEYKYLFTDADYLEAVNNGR